MTEILVTEEGCEQTVTRLARTLAGANLRVTSSDTLNSRGCLQPWELGGLRAAPSFDLHLALAKFSPCPCPQHNSMDCTCQMAVILVHAPGNAWAALVAHSHGAQSWVRLVEATAHFPHTALTSTIGRAGTVLPA